MSNRRELTRAEQVRARRAQRSVKEMQQTAKQATRPLPYARNDSSPASLLSRSSSPQWVARS